MGSYFVLFLFLFRVILHVLRTRRNPQKIPPFPRFLLFDCAFLGDKTPRNFTPRNFVPRRFVLAKSHKSPAMTHIVGDTRVSSYVFHRFVGTFLFFVFLDTFTCVLPTFPASPPASPPSALASLVPVGQTVDGPNWLDAAKRQTELNLLPSLRLLFAAFSPPFVTSKSFRLVFPPVQTTVQPHELFPTICDYLLGADDDQS